MSSLVYSTDNMKKNRLKLIIVFIFSLLFLFSCNKNSNIKTDKDVPTTTYNPINSASTEVEFNEVEVKLKGITFTCQKINLGYKITRIDGPVNTLSITIPDKCNGERITEIDDGVFYGFPLLIEIYNSTDANLEYYASKYGIRNIDEITIHKSLSEKSIIETDSNGYKFALINDKYYYVGYDESYNENIYMYLTLPESFTYSDKTINSYEIRNKAHYYDNVKSVKISKSVTKIGDYAFAKASYIEYEYSRNKIQVEIEDGVKEIGISAFSCTNLKSIIIPNSVTKIGAGAFYWCGDLESVELSNNINEIGDSTFELCEILQDINIPDTVKTIGKNAFHKCTNLKTVHLGLNVEEIYNEAFLQCSNLEKLVMDKNIKTIWNNAFKSCTSINLYYNGTIDDWCNIDFKFNDGELYNYSSNPMFYGKRFYLKDDDGIVKYNNNNYTYLRELVIPDTVKKIKEGSFANFTQIIKLTVPVNVTIIQKESFYGCKRIKEFYDLSYTDKPNKSYYYKYGFTQAVVHKTYDEESIIYIDSNGYAFGYIENDYYLIDVGDKKEIILPETVNFNGNIINEYIIRDDTFMYVDLEKITVNPKSIKDMEKNAFRDCNFINKIEKDRCYYVGDDNNPYLVLVDVNKISSIGYPATDDCYIDNNCQIILPYALSNTHRLIKNLHIPESVVYIGQYAFSDNSFDTIEFKAKINIIPMGLFHNVDGITKIEIPSGVEIIKQNSFSLSFNLEKITLPNSIKYIGRFVISGNSMFKCIEYDGTVEEWNQIEKDENWYDSGGSLYDSSIICTNGEIPIKIS